MTMLFITYGGWTNLILCPDIVHSITFSWNLVTKRDKAHFGFGDDRVKWFKNSLIGRCLDVLLVSRLFLTGEEAALVSTADPCCYTEEHYNHNQHSQYNPNNINVICRVQIRGQKWSMRISLKRRTCYLYLWHTYRLPWAEVDTPHTLHRSSLGSSTRPRLLSLQR